MKNSIFIILTTLALAASQELMEPAISSVINIPSAQAAKPNSSGKFVATLRVLYSIDCVSLENICLTHPPNLEANISNLNSLCFNHLPSLILQE